MVTGGLLLAAGLSPSSAGAAVTNSAKTVPASTAATTPTCDTGIHNTYEYYTLCTSSGSNYYRAVAHCADGNIAMGAEYQLGSKSVSVATCKTDSGLDPADNWGLLFCSSNSGAGTYQGYLNESGDISRYLATVGNGTIATGGTYMCDLDTNASTEIADVPLS
jgi:hypothetical protein